MAENTVRKDTASMENAQEEPSMEEILASIRRIISEDEDDAGGPDPVAELRAVEDEPSSESGGDDPDAAPVAEIGSGVEDRDDQDGDDQVSDNADARLETEDIEMIKTSAAAAVRDEVEDEMVDEQTAEAASSAFQSFSRTMRVSDGPGKTLEDIVTEMLRPMVKEWLDANLTKIVEEKVEDEVQRLARRGR